MKAIDQPFSKIIGGAVQFVIPVFQRDYRWTEGQCEQLWADILAVAADTGSRGHFIGSVVYVSTGEPSPAFSRWLLVDGQQRVTTLTLLLAALRDHLRETGWVGGDDDPTPTKVEGNFLVNMLESGSNRSKLVLRRHDQATLQAIISRTDAAGPESERVRENYEFFREKLMDADPVAVYRGIGRLVVVDVTLTRGVDDPQLIFESLNSTGIDLAQSDLIRNFILMRLPEADQTRMYEEYWAKIEALFRGSESSFESFIRDYIALATKSSKQERSDALYLAFRREFGGVGSDLDTLEEFLGRMLRLARYHAAYSVGGGPWPNLAEPLTRLRRLTDVAGTLVMRLLAGMEDGSVTPGGVSSILRLLESYVMRRAVLGEQSRTYWLVFANIAYRLVDGAEMTGVKVGLARQPDSYRFPMDPEFRDGLERRDLYGKRVCWDVLERLENSDTKEQSDTSGYSIEHIMPQNPDLSAEWREMLGPDWADVQRTWLHRLGNLTLTGYNSRYSDLPFDRKKDIEGGFKQSSVRLNQFVRTQSAWTPAEMAERGRLLAERATKIWPELTIDRALIDEAELADKKSLAGRRDVRRVPMSQRARELFEALRPHLLSISADIIELAEQKSISYHGPAFFVELLPRKNRLNLLLSLDFTAVEDSGGICQDASQWKFLANAVNEGGTLVSLYHEHDIEQVMALVRQSHARSSADASLSPAIPLTGR